MTFRPVVLLALSASLAGCGINSVPTAEENAKARWADVQNQYQRRADLIPNLVSTVKAAGAQEKEVLTEVTQARASATQIQVSGDDLADPAKMQAYQRAQAGLTLSLQRLQEAYPELKSQANYTTLMSQLEGTENRITIARNDYNTAVQAYNTRIRTFPDAIGARIFYGAKPMVPFQATTPGAETAPKVDFGG
ncbi:MULTISPECIES: LemA family protein [unclassified Sphingomonas]|uniref:LemA family protein n=1 Tax=unclassified Sphingomonas TaxID=196159 RepID=UPI001D0F9823|nr:MULTISPECIES: LemA family protein [unclassified Sphingomonas]MCC2979253.1 LemA family protein [Sphingomonas sp. IC4-52]MCD2315513.1 LemA family protein [Sphingomonas sp. IC-11]